MWTHGLGGNHLHMVRIRPRNFDDQTPVGDDEQCSPVGITLDRLVNFDNVQHS
jgi:predicted esterase